MPNFKHFYELVECFPIEVAYIPNVIMYENYTQNLIKWIVINNFTNEIKKY